MKPLIGRSTIIFEQDRNLTKNAAILIYIYIYTSEFHEPRLNDEVRIVEETREKLREA